LIRGNVKGGVNGIVNWINFFTLETAKMVSNLPASADLQVGNGGLLVIVIGELEVRHLIIVVGARKQIVFSF
jgi:hypothetical protein